MDKLNLSNSPVAILSPQDLKALIVEIRRYARWFGQASVKAKVASNAPREKISISEPATILIKQAVGDQALSQKILDELIAHLEYLEAKAPRATITLAAVPGNNLKKSMVEWCRKNIDPGILVDFRFNATILGGMVVQYGSHVYDWSFRRQILANRSKFPEVLRRV